MLNELQLQNHYKGIGGTMASSLVGLNKFQSNIDAYLLLTDEAFRKENQDSVGAKLAVQIGKAVEPVIIEFAANEKGWDVEIIEHTMYDHEYDFLIGHPDFRIKGTRFGGEVKARGFRGTQSYGEEGTDQVSDTDFMQCQHYMMLDGLDMYYLVLWDMAFNQIKYFEVKRHEETIKVMREKQVEFWYNHILPKKPPTPLTYEDSVKLYPRGAFDKSITADAEIEKMIEEAKTLNAAVKDEEMKLDFIKAQIANFMGENSILLNSMGGEIVSFKNQQTNRFDTSLFSKSEPALYEKFLKQTTSRVMRFKK